MSLEFTENQYLVGFSPIVKVSFQRTKKEDFYTHRSFSICCDFKKFNFEIDHLKTILIKNKRNDKRFNNRAYSLFSEVSVIDSKYIKMTGLRYIY